MSNALSHIVPSSYTDLQILAYDPSKTLTLRNAFVADMNRRFRALIKVINEAIITQDCFGLQVQTLTEVTPPGFQQFAYPRVAAKVEAFMTWLKAQEAKGLLEVGHITQFGTGIDEAWTNLYIMDSYKRGVIRGRAELKQAGYAASSIEAEGGVIAVMGGPFHIDRIGVVFTRAFQGLEGITAAMDTQISQILAQGLVDGDGPRLLARKLVAVINGSGAGDLGITDSLGRFIPAQRRAQTLARTEIIRAHHIANIQEYKNWRVLGVTIVAEFATAGDDRVCSECASYHGNRYKLEEVEHMIPVHPNCRCVALPVAAPPLEKK